MKTSNCVFENEAMQASLTEASIAQALRKNGLKHKGTRFATVFASAVGASTIGSALGLPGLFVGAVLGSVIGFYVERRAHA